MIIIEERANLPMILNKKEMTEEDIKLQYITPAITKKWSQEFMTMETKITDGRIKLGGNVAVRGDAKKVDYLLYLNDGNPIAVVEAKDNKHSVSYGMQQAKEYAMMLDLKFAYSSNGDAFEEYDFITGKERQIALEDFPTPEELIGRYKEELGITNDEEKLINQPYYSGQNINTPRYYQRNAVNRTLDVIAKGQNRILLTMATGTGKTYTAFQIIYRLIKSGAKRKVLYLADRNNLVDQSISGDFAPLEKTIHKINFAKDSKTTIGTYEVYFALYQQMFGLKEEDVLDDEEVDENKIAERYKEYFKPDFFDLIIVDECHRGSAKADSRWRRVLEYFYSATQIGMTATPKETKYTSNIDYFGEPVYSYSLKQGIDDGFLAPFKVISINTNISDGWRPYKGQLDYYGKEIEDRIYNNKDYDYNIVILDRIEAVAKEITQYLKQTGCMQKTIVFCPTEDAAERMRIALVNQNSDMCKENPDYVVRITGSDDYGKSKLDYFISVSSEYPVIATTSKLLSTGTDAKMTKLIVIDQMINSMTEFKQIIGRGTRIREQDGKTHFAVMDFRGVTRLFADPDWDGPIEQDEEYGKPKTTKDAEYTTEENNGELKTGEHINPIVDENGCRVSIINKMVSVYDTDGKLLKQESIIDYTKSNILGNYATLDNFIKEWNEQEKKEKITEMLNCKGIDLEAIKEEHNMTEVDDFDFICHVAYDKKPLTRKERAENVKKRDFLSKYSGVAREVLEALLEKYKDYGISELENAEVLKLDPFRQYGKPAKIAQEFGGPKAYNEAIRELENEIYKAV